MKSKILIRLKSKFRRNNIWSIFIFDCAHSSPTFRIIKKLKAIDSDLDEALRKECTKKVPIAGKRGQFNQETDTDKYIGKMCVACVVYPDLNNAELQDSYGVKSADALLKKMLLPGEYTELKAKVMEVNGYDMSMEELVDEAKN